MSDNIFVKYSKNNPNFYDGYWRQNPRRNAQCNPILYRDNYKPYFKSNLNYRLSNQNPCQVDIEGFSNLPPNNNVQVVNSKNVNHNSNRVVPNKNNQQVVMKNCVDLDTYGQIEDITCNGSQAKVKFNQGKPIIYDIDLPSIMKKEIIGDIEEIDYIHNKKIKNQIHFGDMKLKHLHNTMQKLHYQMNPSLLHAHQRDFRRENFFQDK